jgi:hypothetical protein
VIEEKVVTLGRRRKLALFKIQQTRQHCELRAATMMSSQPSTPVNMERTGGTTARQRPQQQQQASRILGGDFLPYRDDPVRSSIASEGAVFWTACVDTTGRALRVTLDEHGHSKRDNSLVLVFIKIPPLTCLYLHAYHAIGFVDDKKSLVSFFFSRRRLDCSPTLRGDGVPREVLLR